MAKKLKIKLPKKVAGVKIPKTVRKGPIAGFLNSSAGQLVLAEALVATAGAFAVKETDPDSAAGDALRHPIDKAKRAGHSAAHAASDVKEQASAQAAHLSFALSEAVKAFRAAMEREDWEVGRERELSEPGRGVEIEAEPLGKKKQTGAGTAHH